MNEVAQGQITAPEMMFVVILGLGLAILNGGVAAVVPARSRSGWLSIMALAQLALGGLLVVAARSTLTPQGGDIRYAIGILFAAPVLFGGLIAGSLWAAERFLRRRNNRL